MTWWIFNLILDVIILKTFLLRWHFLYFWNFLYYPQKCMFPVCTVLARTVTISLANWMGSSGKTWNWNCTFCVWPSTGRVKIIPKMSSLYVSSSTTPAKERYFILAQRLFTEHNYKQQLHLLIKLSPQEHHPMSGVILNLPCHNCLPSCAIRCQLRPEQQKIQVEEHSHI